MNSMIAAYQAYDPLQVETLFGPAGRLMESIENGELPDVFASAAMKHIDALLATGKMRSGSVFATNSMCVIAAAGVQVSPDNLVDVLLDPKIRLGTSTPGADPSGDYALQIFRNIDRIKPGAFALLEKKAMPLVGAQIESQQTSSPLLPMITEKKADVFIAYRTSAVHFSKIVPDLSWTDIPVDINVSVRYGIGALAGADQRADRFVDFVIGPEGKTILEQYGFQSAP